MKLIRFLTLAEVALIHKNQIELYGGDSGIRDFGLLSSAVSMPMVSYDGHYLHETIYEMAAAYLYHICQNHPFVDGNKRVGLVSCLVFLDLNGIEVYDKNNKLYRMTIKVAKGEFQKSDIVKILKELV